MMIWFSAFVITYTVCALVLACIGVVIVYGPVGLVYLVFTVLMFCAVMAVVRSVLLKLVQ